MEEQFQQDLDGELDERQGSGSLLASARKELGKTVEEIATELNLSISQIKTIELDQTDGLPEPTYVRGYIRSYAKLLGLDSEQVLKNYLNPNWQQSTNFDDMPRGIANVEDLSGRRFLSPTKWVALVLLLSIGGYLWYSGVVQQLVAGRDAQWGSSTTAAELEETQALIQPNTELAIQPDFSLPEESTTSATSGDVELPELADIEAIPPIGVELVLNISQTSWIDIRDEQDKRLAYKSYTEGETLRVLSEGAMHVFISNAGGVSVLLNGNPYDISSYREGVYARFTVGDDL